MFLAIWNSTAQQNPHRTRIAQAKGIALRSTLLTSRRTGREMIPGPMLKLDLLLAPGQGLSEVLQD
jgi:hypothetical protein